MTIPQPRRRLVIGLLLSIAFVLTFAAGGVGGFLLARDPVASSRPSKWISNALPPSDDKEANSVDFTTFWQAWDTVTRHYYGKPDALKRLDGAIGGMVSGLGDPYTVYMEPAQSKIFQEDLNGSFGGIGAELIVRDGLLTIVAPLEGTPAAQAGLQPNDIIYEIDGTKTADLSLNDAIDKIRGEEGSEVVLTIVRKGSDEPFKVTLKRATITVQTIKTHDIKDGTVSFIKVNQFGADTSDLMKQALSKAVQENKKGAIIDLRNNPGGYLDKAVEVIGMLIPDKPETDNGVLNKRVAVLERSKDGSERQDSATNTSVAPSLPIVFLVNGGSASASEIVAGAMKDYKRATVIGTTTFGKGSVQNLYPLSNGGSIKVTIAKWFTPLGNGIDGKGIEPDITVELPKDADATDNDVQVQKALEVLNK